MSEKPLPERGEFIVRGSYVMSMDPAIGDISKGDVYVRDGMIVGVAKNIIAAVEVIDGSDTVLMPGFVDTHTHLWSTQMRGKFGDTEEEGYFRTRNRLADGYRAEDMYKGTKLGAAECLYSGITTVVDFCHNVRDREFAEQCIDALTDTGLRARFQYGASTITRADEVIDLDHVEQLAGNWASRVGDAPVTFGLAWRGPGGMGNGTIREIEAARALCLPVSVHVSGNKARRQFDALASGGFLDGDLQLVHMSNATETELQAIRDSNASVSLTPLTELRVGYGITKLGDYLNAELRTGIGIDSNSLAGSADMFAVMKVFQNIEAGRRRHESAISARRLLELATIEGAASIGVKDIVGSITPGKRADLILINTRSINMGMFAENPAHLLVESARPDNVVMVVADGRILKRDGMLTVLDADMIVNEARESIAGVVRRLQ